MLNRNNNQQDLNCFVALSFKVVFSRWLSSFVPCSIACEVDDGTVDRDTDKCQELHNAKPFSDSTCPLALQPPAILCHLIQFDLHFKQISKDAEKTCDRQRVGEQSDHAQLQDALKVLFK